MSPDHYGSYLERLAKAFVSRPDVITVTTILKPMSAGAGVRQLLLRGHATDQGRLIGKMGIMAQSLQIVINTISAKDHIRIHMQVLEPSVPLQDGETKMIPYQQSQDENRDKEIQGLLTETADELFGKDDYSIVTEKTKSGTDGTEQIEISMKVRKQVAPELEAALGRIFRSIGKHMGRPVSIHINPTSSESKCL